MLGFQSVDQMFAPADTRTIITKCFVDAATIFFLSACHTNPTLVAGVPEIGSRLDLGIPTTDRGTDTTFSSGFSDAMLVYAHANTFTRDS